MDGAVTTLARNVMTRTSAATGEETFTAAMVVNGIYHQTGTPGAVAKLFPSAASMWALIPGAIVGTSFDFIFHNGGDGEVTLTTDTGTTVTLYGTATVTAAKTRKCKIVFTSATAASCYCMAELA
jgi:hypothetical protein